jgi:hypothetical protein
MMDSRILVSKGDEMPNEPISNFSMHEWIIELCKVLELDPSRVQNIDLHVHIDSAVTVTVEHYVQRNQVDGLEIMIRKLSREMK